MCFRYVPLWQRLHRLKLFLDTDNLASVYGPDEERVSQRKAVEQNAKDYIYSMCPEEYHGFIVPDFPLGCKRRIFDPGYLECLSRDNIELVPEGIKEVVETGIISSSGRYEEFDVIVLATGFQVQNFLGSIEIVGKSGKALKAQWASQRGAQAYMGTYVHNFPNFGML
jgi:cation diffusion facilitator CzcD-associated flavoprotein CzcO